MDLIDRLGSFIGVIIIVSSIILCVGFIPGLDRLLVLLQFIACFLAGCTIFILILYFFMFRHPYPGFIMLWWVSISISVITIATIQARIEGKESTREASKPSKVSKKPEKTKKSDLKKSVQPSQQHYFKGCCLAINGKFEKAKREFEIALKIDPNSESVIRALNIIKDIWEQKIKVKLRSIFSKR